MKKINLLITITISLIIVSCSDDFASRNLGEKVSADQIKDVATSSPEGLLTIVNGLEAGNNFFLNDFNTAQGGNIHDDYGQKSIDLDLDLMSNDMVMAINSWHGNCYRYTGRQVENRITSMIWKFYYKIIYNMNLNLKLLPADTSVQELKYLRARTKAMRAFAYFNLVRIYANGEVGIPIYSNQEITDVFGRGATSTIKALILSDLEYAYNNLTGYSRANKLYMDKRVVAGLLARYYLEYATSPADYNKAAQYAIEARGGVTLMSSNMINFQDANWDGFSNIDNPEWIWGTDIDGSTSTVYASFFSQMGSLNAGYAGLLNAFKIGDRRLVDAIPATDKRTDWFNKTSNGLSAPSGAAVPNRANLKFYDSTSGFLGDYVYMRAAEMYLIEAEAKFLAGDETGAKNALTTLVSTRDTAYSNSALTGVALRDHIRFQRSLELWGEGFSFFDMKRWNLPLDRTYTGTNHTTFGLVSFPAGSTKFIFQIPQVEILNNTYITENNPF